MPKPPIARSGRSSNDKAPGSSAADHRGQAEPPQPQRVRQVKLLPSGHSTRASEPLIQKLMPKGAA